MGISLVSSEWALSVRSPQSGSVLLEEKYGEDPYVSADEIKKALLLKAVSSSMLDLMQ